MGCYQKYKLPTTVVSVKRSDVEVIRTVGLIHRQCKTSSDRAIKVLTASKSKGENMAPTHKHSMKGTRQWV
ncbi:hypothetical protein CCACVL1_11923, partial [Corchorus capsularis]